MKILKIVLITLVIVAGSIFGTYYFLERSKVNDLNKKLEIAINTDFGITETILKIEDDSKSMSYKELFELCDKSITDRTNLLVELRAVYPEIDSRLKDSLISFLTLENELVRNKSRIYRCNMNYKLADENWEDNHKSWNSSDYLNDYYSERSHKLIEEMIEHTNEGSMSNLLFWENYASLLSKEKSIEIMMKEEGLRHIPIYNQHHDLNEKFFSNNMELDSLRRKHIGI